MRDGRPINKKLITILVLVFVLISILIFYGLNKIQNRKANTKAAVVKPEGKEIIAPPPARLQIVPPLTQPALPAQAQNGAIPLSSEKMPGTVQPQTLSSTKSAATISSSTVHSLSLEEKRSKMGGRLMVEVGGAGADSPEAMQNELGWKKRLQPSNVQAGEYSETNSKTPVALPITASSTTAQSTAAGLTNISAALAADPRNPRLNAIVASMGIPTGVTGQGISPADSTQASKLLPAETSGLAGSSRGKSSSTIEAQRLSTDRNYLVPRGSNITCVLDSRLVSDLNSSASCTVNKNVYSMNGAYRLIPKGSRLSGRFNSGISGNDRLSVIWDRILTPEGIDIAISEVGTDEMGSTGIPGEFDGHWGKKLSAAILVSLAGDLFKLGSVKYGPTQQTTTTDAAGKSTVEIKPYESIAVDILSKVPAQIAAKSLATPDTITIPQGQLVNVMTTQDIDFRQAKANL